MDKININPIKKYNRDICTSKVFPQNLLKYSKKQSSDSKAGLVMKSKARYKTTPRKSLCKMFKILF